MGTFLSMLLLGMALGFHRGYPQQQGHAVIWQRTQITKVLVFLCIISAILIAWVDYHYSAV